SRLPGGDRVYVHLDGPLSYKGWIDGLKAGKSFVTNGPMLTFTANGKEPGAVLAVGEKPKLRLKAAARSPFPLTKAELVHNGKGTRYRHTRQGRAGGDTGSGGRVGERGLAGVPRRRAWDH